MSVGRYCVVSPAPNRCIENTIILDPSTPGGAAYKTAIESEGKLVIPEAQALSQYDACPVDPNAP